MNNRGFVLLNTILLLMLCGIESLAVPPDPRVHRAEMDQPIPEMMESLSIRPAGSATGFQEIVVILIEFQDVNHDLTHDEAYFNDLLFSDSDRRSMYSYYQEVSYGQMPVSGVITGWYRSDYSMAYYGADGAKKDRLNGRIYELAREAVQLADAAGFDFSQYDKDHDGYVDHIIVIHAGPGQESGGEIYGSDAIWSHHWSIWPREEVDGVQAADYSMIAESSPMGVAAHEFGHDLGLPDLYDTDGSSEGIGVWGLMGYGIWQMGGDVPAQLCAWSKVFLGWVTPREITADEIGLILNSVELSSVNTIVKIPLISDEYFLLENRHNTGFDQYLPGEGLLIWHIDDSVGTIRLNDVNDSEDHKRVDLEEADGRDDLDKRANSGDHTDPYYMDNIRAFTPFTVPDSRLYSGDSSDVSIVNISDPGAAMTLDIRFGANPMSASIHLVTGWNLISLCLQPFDTDCRSVLSSVEGKYDSVWTYDAVTGRWRKYAVDGPFYLNDLNNMESGIGYWIVMNQPGTLIIQGTQPASWIPLKAGQNLVGYNLQTPMSVEDCLSSAEGRLDSIRTYDPETGKWLFYNPGAPAFLNDLEFLEPGKGYRIDAKEDCIWNPGGN